MSQDDGPDIRLGFTGAEEDKEVGLVNLVGRIYDPQIGRFLTADPVVPDPFWGQAYNRYSYVSNNPLTFTDSTGFQEDPGVIGGGPDDYEIPYSRVPLTPTAPFSCCASQHESQSPGPGITAQPNRLAADDLGMHSIGEWNGPVLRAENPKSAATWNPIVRAADGTRVTERQLEEARATVAIGEQGRNIAYGLAPLSGIGFVVGGGKGAELGAWLGIYAGGIAHGYAQGASAEAIFSAASVSSVLPRRTPELRFSQESASPWFSAEGGFAGKTISDVAAQLRAGTLAPSSVPVGVLPFGSISFIVDTRSSLSLTRAGVPQTQWNLIDLTGNAARESAILDRLTHNELGIQGVDVIRITGSGKPGEPASTVAGSGNIPMPPP